MIPNINVQKVIVDSALVYNCPYIALTPTFLGLSSGYIPSYMNHSAITKITAGGWIYVTDMPWSLPVGEHMAVNICLFSLRHRLEEH